MGDSNLYTIRMLSLDHSVAFGSGIFGKLIERHRPKAVAYALQLEVDPACFMNNGNITGKAQPPRNAHEDKCSLQK